MVGSGIRKKPIPDPGSGGQKGTGSRIRIRNTEYMYTYVRSRAVTEGYDYRRIIRKVRNEKSVSFAARLCCQVQVQVTLPANFTHATWALQFGNKDASFSVS
jgi:hypothetical protein